MDDRKPPPIEYLPGIRDLPGALDMLEDSLCGATHEQIAEKHGASASRVRYILSLTFRHVNNHAAQLAGIPAPPIPRISEARRSLEIWRARIEDMRHLSSTQRGGFHRNADPRLYPIAEADFRSRLAGLVRQARDRRGWTQPQLARAIGKDQPYIGQIERAFAAPSPHIFTLLIRELDLTIPELIGLLEPMPEDPPELKK